MKCVLDKKEECTNEDFSACAKCIAPTWCLCTREGAAPSVERVICPNKSGACDCPDCRRDREDSFDYGDSVGESR